MTVSALFPSQQYRLGAEGAFDEVYVVEPHLHGRLPEVKAVLDGHVGEADELAVGVGVAEAVGAGLDIAVADVLVVGVLDADTNGEPETVGVAEAFGSCKPVTLLAFPDAVTVPVNWIIDVSPAGIFRSELEGLHEMDFFSVVE